MNGLTDVPGILVGHVTDAVALTGCTVILCGNDAVGGVDVRGSATGSVELDTLRPGHVAPNVHAFVLSGGSAFGLESTSGVRNLLEKRGVGYNASVTRVPIVPGAILFDLGIGDKTVRPTREMGEKAAMAANAGPVAEGNVGAGTGATVGKILGMKTAMKSGLGTASVLLGNGTVVAAMVAVNAVGDVIDPQTGRIVAGARVSEQSRAFANSTAMMRHGLPTPREGNTVIGIIATNAKLDRVQTNKLAALGSLGVVRTISPINTMSDGDITFAVSLGNAKASVDEVGVAAADAMATAVLRAVRTAKTAGGVPGLAG
jgi:L-aminopeptidase/D-esterase-like protein